MKAKIILITFVTMLSFGTKSIAQKVEKVTFNNNNLKMAGNLYLPAAFNENKKYPVIITVHPGGGVKEQTSGLYAQKMAEQGYVALAFDASHQGESEGLPRFLEDPTQRVEDIRSAVDYVTTLKFVDAEKIGLIGICAGGGYSINAAQTEHRIKAIAVASPVSTGNKKGWDGKTPISESITTLEAVAKQRSAEANGAKPIYINYVPEKPNANTPNDLIEAYDYYRTPRAQHPNSTNLFLFTSLDKMMAFDAYASIETLLTQPILIIVGSKAGSRWQGEDIYKRVTSPKELKIIEGATHMDLYDIPKYVNQVANTMTHFFGENLK
ncbi:MAG TPA: alpha/beta hydrolase [Flavobacterium sp.]|uniref:alpha/beta hydrolase n=1 Tax=Flavobacterium sp. TaxID=239 RepID=UPI002DBBB6D6|nr:alpha/beta hydrolase [Flavobacterium sp.]HEU4790050.1 alpha/beta hydrolase [Flavobacterium sp.]